MATWSDLPSQIQNEAVLLLEGGVGVDFPLKACVGNWGARLLMVHAFQKCKVKEAVEPEEGDARINASAEGRYVLLRVFFICDKEVLAQDEQVAVSAEVHALTNEVSTSPLCTAVRMGFDTHLSSNEDNEFAGAKALPELTSLTNHLTSF
ncbi:uncharacterized protein BYT42DRAFT_615302 [Radiomyces spectabilis]|uniref:uncharacterized protein n=1 Tax=Radiomyces spectabilis TaxID=64574 RepID=UPI002220B220|nr:uncharacterized protein BYT42DRAFT_615302 [Radiomyces spectabilis]KAI8376575.1 hypothetical protein BYT42DRAFT_615302 [Radiomyces spectabilis]